MFTYIRKQIDDVITVRSIVTVLRLDLRNRLVLGEFHDFPEIYYVEQGKSTTVIDGIPTVLEAGSMVIYAPNSMHGDVAGKVPGGIVEIISFETDSSALKSLYNRPFKLSPRLREKFETLNAKGRAIFATPEAGKDRQGLFPSGAADPRELQQLKNLLELFLLDLLHSPEKSKGDSIGSNQEQFYRQQMDALTTYLMDNLGQNLSLAQMETAMGLSESSLRRLVRKYKGCGPVAYFQELKIQEAKRLIRDSSLNMTEISERLNFSSLHYFSRVFREKNGISPTDYAKDIK